MNSGYRLDDWVIRPQHACIERGGEVIHLKPKPMAVLECLCRAGGEVVTRDALFDSVWPGGVVSDATLTQCIVELRRAFGDSAQSPRVIKTIPKVGFCLIPPIEQLEAETRIPADRNKPDKQWISKRPGLMGAVLVFLVLAVGAWWIQRDVADSVPKPAVRISDMAPSIAVLPFVNMSEDPGNEYFSDGLSEELQILLAKIPELKVSARTSSFSFRNKDVTIAEIASALNVAHVLEGSVRKAGDRIRISVQLIEAQSGFELWSESYDRTLDHIFDVQNEVASAVVDALRVSLMNEPAQLQETNPEVYSLYLQAGFFINQMTREGRVRAVEKLREALAIDPTYAPAVDRLASAYLMQTNRGERPFEAGVELGRRTAEEALAIDAGLANTWGTLVYIESRYDWDWQGAGRKVERMLELESGNAGSFSSAANYYNMVGRFDLSLELRNLAIQLDPISYNIGVRKTFVLMAMGRLDEAMRNVQAVFQTYPDDRRLQQHHAKLLLLSGDFEGAYQALETIQPRYYTDTALLAMVLHSLGRESESRAAFEMVVQSGPNASYTGGVNYHRGLYYAWTGNRDLSFKHLQLALESGHRPLAYILGEPLLYSLHNDARWQKLLEEIGLLPYWLEVPEQYGGPAR